MAANEGIFFTSGSVPMALVDDQLEVLSLNPALLRLLGTTQSPGRILELCAAVDRERVGAALLRCSAAGPEHFEATLLAAGGRTVAMDWTVDKHPDSGVLLLVLREREALVLLEAELARLQPLAALGQLASGVAHEINTPVQYIGDNLVFLSEALQELAPLLKSLEGESSRALVAAHPEVDLPFLLEELPRAAQQGREGVERIVELVRGMKEFAHRDEGRVCPVDVNRAVQSTLAVARNEWRYVADVESVFAELPLVPFQPGALRQVLLNLVCNAAQAVGEHNVRTGRTRGLLRITTSLDADCVVVAIADTGGGIPSAVAERIFEPFFTTKPVGKGTGQGLAIARSLCERYGGTLEFVSEDQVGTTFRVRLPLVSPGA